jgi:glyoxylase-like metal-dependent hydrolase (beta-lactamase superfamily II)
VSGGASTVAEVADADVTHVRADNPSLLTLSGTNTWVIGRDPAWVVDPGPALEPHLEAVAAACAERGGAGGIAVTHGHADHVEAVGPLRERLGGAAVVLGPGPLEVVPVPGHADDHVCLVWGDVCCTGDAVLGEGSVFVAGDMAGYLDGLRALRARDDPALRLLLPGHGPVVPDARAKLDEYLAHRLDREARLAEALDRGLRGEDALLDEVWADAPDALRIASQLTLRSHLRKLGAEGRLPADVEPPPAPGELPAI